MLTRLRWIDLLLINVFWVGLNFLWNSLHSIILPLRILEVAPGEAKGTALGVLTFLGLILAMVYQPIIGAVSDASPFMRGRRRPFIFLGTLFNIVFFALLIAAGNYWLLFAFYLLLQFSSNTAQGPYQGLIPDLVPEAQRGSAAGLKQLIEVFSAILSTLIAGYMMERGLVWATAGLIITAMALSMLITMIFVREPPAGQIAGKPLLSDLRETFRVQPRAYADYMWLVLSRFFVFVALTSVQIFMLFFIKDVLGAPNYTELTGQVTAILGFGVLLVVYPAGYLSDRLGRKPMLIAASLVAAVAMLLLLRASSLTELLAYGGILGLSMGVFLSVNWALGTDLVPRGEAAKYMGLSNVATAGGSAAARLGGPVLDFFNAQGPNWGYTAIFLIDALCFLLGALVLLRVREKRAAAVPTTS